jgi:uncharacterized membrane protein YfcA
MFFVVAQITVSIPILLAWGVVVGLVYSTVGAAGGILASVGLITVFGIQDPNLVKPMAQVLTLVTPLIAVPLYMRQFRVVYVLSALLGVGGIVGAFIGSSLSATYLSDMSVFKPIFAGLVFFIAGQLAWQIYRSTSGSYELTHTMRAAESYERHIKSGGLESELGVKRLQVSASRIVIGFGNEEFSFHPLLPLDYPLLGFLVVGIIVGSVTGPWLSRYIPENGLRGFLCVVLLMIGLRYAGLF